MGQAAKTGRLQKDDALSNHLGNVLSVITDNVNMNADSAWATIVSAQDVFPFGLEMSGRDWQLEDYRYGFNSKERDNAFGSVVFDYGFRIYSPKIGKFLSTDPLTSTYPWYTPYQFAGNSPIKHLDIDGLEPSSNYADYRMSDALQQEAEQHYQNFGQPAEQAVGGKFEDGSIYVEFTKKYYEFLGELAAFEVAGATVGEVAGGLLRGTKLGGYLGLTDDVARARNISSGKPAIPKSTAQEIKTLHTDNIKFSQSSVNGADDLVQSMKQNGWNGDPIDVVDLGGGSYGTLDNTRVLAAHEAGIEVRAVTHKYNDPLPDNLVERFTTKKDGAPSTWGEAYQLRVNKQKASYRKNNSEGSQHIQGNLKEN